MAREGVARNPRVTTWGVAQGHVAYCPKLAREETLRDIYGDGRSAAGHTFPGVASMGAMGGYATGGARRANALLIRDPDYFISRGLRYIAQSGYEFKFPNSISPLIQVRR